MDRIFLSGFTAGARFSKYIAYQIILEIGFYFTRSWVEHQGGDIFIFAYVSDQSNHDPVTQSSSLIL